MNDVVASAPGKLVLLGEYAVLEGAPAIVLAVNRRAQARIAERDDDFCEVHAPDLDIATARARIGADGDLHWLCAQTDVAKLELVTQIWRGARDASWAPSSHSGFDLCLDTAGFFHSDGTARVKLGLGSSAALTVALASALANFAGHDDLAANRNNWLSRLLHLHGRWQQGRGSGVDIAASLCGGLIDYRLHGQGNDKPSVVPLLWPNHIHCRFVWSGKPVSTADYLRRLAQWKSENTSEYAAHMQALGTLSAAAADALQTRNGAGLIVLVYEYAMTLERFGNACGLEIFSPAQRRIREISVRAGIAYKPCGAGGDFGVMFADDPQRLDGIADDIAATGSRCIPLALDPQGLTCTMQLRRNARIPA